MGDIARRQRWLPEFLTPRPGHREQILRRRSDWRPRVREGLAGCQKSIKVVEIVSPTLLDVSRWQFIITIVFHMTFPAITVGLSVFLTVVYGLHLRTGRAIYLQIFRFWKRIFAVGFGLGVVSGTVITFELGLNWGRFASATGPILGPIIGMEVVSAFFVEAVHRRDALW